MRVLFIGQDRAYILIRISMEDKKGENPPQRRRGHREKSRGGRPLSMQVFQQIRIASPKTNMGDAGDELVGK
jgi:hypothetical protein